MANVEIDRAPRASKTQATKERRKPWAPPS